MLVGVMECVTLYAMVPARTTLPAAVSGELVMKALTPSALSD